MIVASNWPFEWWTNLILDDFAMREYTTHQADDLYDLMGERTRDGLIIVTTNCPPQNWYSLFPNPVLAEGALGRVLGRALQLVLQGRSFRQYQRPSRAHRVSPKPASETLAGSTGPG